MTGSEYRLIGWGRGARMMMGWVGLSHGVIFLRVRDVVEAEGDLRGHLMRRR